MSEGHQEGPRRLLIAMALASGITSVPNAATLGGLGATFGVAVSGAVFEILQTDRTVRAVAERGVRISDAAEPGRAVLGAGAAAVVVWGLDLTAVEPVRTASGG